MASAHALPSSLAPQGVLLGHRSARLQAPKKKAVGATGARPRAHGAASRVGRRAADLIAPRCVAKTRQVAAAPAHASDEAAADQLLAWAQSQGVDTSAVRAGTRVSVRCAASSSSISISHARARVNVH